MKQQQQYDIFVSYRRTSFDTANLIATKLQMAGYSVFFDVETLRSGKFNERLFEVIEQCRDFVLVLPPDALDRCVDEDDWVRLEVEHAMKHGKNIVPIMLRGFVWPAASTLPESMRELPNYNAITAADPNVFAENMERLKRSFLLSRPKVSWQKYRMMLYLVCAIVIGVVCFVMLGRGGETTPQSGAEQDDTTQSVMVQGEDVQVEVAPSALPADAVTTSDDATIEDTPVVDKRYADTCADYAVLLFGEYAKSDINMGILDSAFEAWYKFAREFDSDDATSQRGALESTIEQYRLQLMEPEKIVVSEADEQILRSGGFKKSEISMFNMACREYYKEINSQLDFLLMFAQSDNPSMVVDFCKNCADATRYSLEINYYSMLHTFSHMPKSVYDELYASFPTLSYFSNVPLKLSSEEYERMANATTNKMEEAIRRMSVDVNSLDFAM